MAERLSYEDFTASTAAAPPNRGGGVSYEDFTKQDDSPARPPTLQERSQEVYGFEDLPVRGNLLPVGRTQEGGLTPAVPGFLKDMLESALLPGHVTGTMLPELPEALRPYLGNRLEQAGSYTPEDATRFSLDWLAPATSRTRLPGAKEPMTAGRLRRIAPSTEALKAAALKSKAAAAGSGVVVNPNAQNSLLSRLVRVAYAEDVTPGLHDATVSVLKKLGTKAGKSPTVEQLIRQRQLLQDAAASGRPADQRVVRLMLDEFDDFIDNLQPADLISGTSDDLGRNLGDFRSLWTKAKKSETIEAAIEKAARTASGFENGIRQEFRAILNNPKRSRGFSQAEKEAMERVVLGKGANLYKLIGKLGFALQGNRMLGGMIGTAAGASLAGPPGAAGVMAAGALAAQGAERATLQNALTARAMAATGQKPVNPVVLRLLENALTKKGAGPVLGTGIETPDPENIDAFLTPGLS